MSPKILIAVPFLLLFISCKKEISKAKNGSDLYGHWFHYSSPNEYENLNVFYKGEGSVYYLTQGNEDMAEGEWYLKKNALLFKRTNKEIETFVIDTFPQMATQNFIVGSNTIYSGHRYMYLNGNIYHE